MHPETVQVAKHMRDYGLSVLGRAVADTTFSEMARPFAHAMAVTLAAHGAEIVVKARIAEQHPLLIFSQLPKSKVTDGPLSISELIVHGRTFMYSELPERLWAATGYRMTRVDAFVEFGELRNRIMHFAVPNQDLSGDVLRFVFTVMEPMIVEFWGETALKHAQRFDDATVEHLGEQLQRLEIAFPPHLHERLARFMRSHPDPA